jgi:hypothetical protein
MSDPTTYFEAYFEGRLQGLLLAANLYEANIKGSFDPHQVATILRAMAEIEVRVHPDRFQGKPDLQGPNAFR